MWFMDWPCPVSAALQNGSQDFFFSFLFSLLIFIYFLKYETIVRSSVSSFGHSDADPGSVLSYIHTLIRYFFYHCRPTFDASLTKN